MKYLKRPAPPRSSNGEPVSVSLGDWGELFPALCEFLSEAHWEPGVPRVPGTLTLFCDDGQWKACLSDKDAGRVAFVSSTSPYEVIEACESGLVAGSLDWRVSYGQKSTRKKN